MMVYRARDLFRSDGFTSPRDQYILRRHIYAEDDDPNSVLDRIFAADNRLKLLQDEYIGSVPLYTTYFDLFSNSLLLTY
jgi:hypothetical protein